MAGQPADRFSIDADLSGIDIVETHQQINQRCLSASGRTDNRNTHTGLYIEVEVFDQLFVFVIAKCHIVDRHISGHGIDGSGRIGTLLFFFQKFENTAGARKRVLHLRDNGTDIIEWFHVLVCV